MTKEGTLAPECIFEVDYSNYEKDSIGNDDSPLDIEFQNYDDQKFLIDIKQEGKYCEYDSEGDGGTQDQFVTFRFLDKTGKIQSVRSSEFADLPLELSEENEEEYIQNVKEVAQNFYKKIS